MSNAPVLLPFRGVTFTDDFTAALAEGVIPKSTRQQLDRFCEQIRRIMEGMRQPSIRDRGMHTKMFRREFKVAVRATLREEVIYVEKALTAFEQLLDNPRELAEKGAGHLHHLARQLGVEPALTSRQDDRDHKQTPVRDWMANVRTDLEDALKEALGAVPYVDDAGVNEEVLDQDILNADMDYMVALWKVLRRVIFADQLSGPSRDLPTRQPSSWFSSLSSAAPARTTVSSRPDTATPQREGVGIELMDVDRTSLTLPSASAASFPASGLPRSDESRK